MCRTGIQIVDLMVTEGVQEIGDGGSGGKRACLSLGTNSGLVTGGLGKMQGLEAETQIGVSDTEIGLRAGSVTASSARTKRSHISLSREGAKDVAKLAPVLPLHAWSIMIRASAQAVTFFNPT